MPLLFGLGAFYPSSEALSTRSAAAPALDYTPLQVNGPKLKFTWAMYIVLLMPPEMIPHAAMLQHFSVVQELGLQGIKGQNIWTCQAQPQTHPPGHRCVRKE